MKDIEKEILSKIKNKTGKPLMLPIDIWLKLLSYCEQTEDYETCKILFDLIDIVTLQTVKEFIAEDDREWHKRNSVKQ